MFESDDFDEVLSEFDFPEVSSNKQPKAGDENKDPHIDQSAEFLCDTSQVAPHRPVQNLSNSGHNVTSEKQDDLRLVSTKALTGNSTNKEDCFVSPKHLKRKIIESHFNNKSKRKFPGPAGLLSGTLEASNDDTVGDIELLSQDIEYTEHQHRDLFETPLWIRLLNDLKSKNISDLDSIEMIKEKALAGNLQKKKAQIVTGFVETVDRSVPDPLMTLRDATGTIKCNLHKEAWTIFSPYIASEYCALVLWKPTVLTTGGVFKKHYLNITMNNVYAIYSSAVLKDSDREEFHLPEGYTMSCEDSFTVIKTEKSSQSDSSAINSVQNESTDVLDELESIFSDDLF